MGRGNRAQKRGETKYDKKGNGKSLPDDNDSKRTSWDRNQPATLMGPIRSIANDTPKRCPPSWRRKREGSAERENQNKGDAWGLLRQAFRCTASRTETPRSRFPTQNRGVQRSTFHESVSGSAGGFLPDRCTYEIDPQSWINSFSNLGADL
jgi:hypothetical protein